MLVFCFVFFLVAEHYFMFYLKFFQIVLKCFSQKLERENNENGIQFLNYLMRKIHDNKRTVIYMSHITPYSLLFFFCLLFIKLIIFKI